MEEEPVGIISDDCESLQPALADVELGQLAAGRSAPCAIPISASSGAATFSPTSAPGCRTWPRAGWCSRSPTPPSGWAWSALRARFRSCSSRLFGGVIADRVNKRRLLLVTQTVMMLLAFLLAALAWSQGHHASGKCAAIAFLNGVAMAMNAPSYQALVPRLVQARRPDQRHRPQLRAVQHVAHPRSHAGRIRHGAAGRGRQLLPQRRQLSGRAVGAGAHSISRRTRASPADACGRACAAASPTCAASRRCWCWSG